MKLRDQSFVKFKKTKLDCEFENYKFLRNRVVNALRKNKKKIL